MKLGVLSDIHADAQSLDKALKLLERKGADHLICAGDLVDGETEGEEAAQRVKALNIPVVMGNHDYLYARIGEQAAMREAQRNQRIAQGYVRDLLSDDSYAYLGTLPHARELVYDGVKIVLAHANTWDFQTYIFPSSSSLPKLKRLQESIAPDVKAVILGHTHVPMWMRYHSLHVFNPGSVEGNRYSMSRSCAVITLPSPPQGIEFTVYEIDRGAPLTIESLNFYPS